MTLLARNGRTGGASAIVESCSIFMSVGAVGGILAGSSPDMEMIVVIV